MYTFRSFVRIKEAFGAKLNGRSNKEIPMTRINIASLPVKEEIRSTFLVKFIALVDGKDGKSYLNVVLTDGTGDMESRVWTNAPEIKERIAKNDFVEVQGKVNIFQGRKQLIISDIQKLDPKMVNQDDFIMKASRSADDMFLDLEKVVMSLNDVYIKELLILILSDAEISRRLKLWQAGKSIHHAYQSGLLEHILSCSELALTLSKHYQVNENYVVAGTILHDLCKIYELSSGFTVDYTEEGKLVGHLARGVELVDRYSYKIKNFPHDLKMHLKHILLSHHGHYEFGSPKLPQTSEAFLVHLIDLMDSKMNSMEMVKRTDNNTGHWSNFVKHLDRIVYKDPLPFYSEFLPDNFEPKAKVIRADKYQEKKTNQPPAPLKQNLGKMLEGFKVSDE